MDFLLNVDPRRLLEPKIIIAPPEINHIFFFDQVVHRRFDFFDTVRSGEDADDFLLSRFKALELFENVDQRDGLDDFAFQTIFFDLVKDYAGKDLYPWIISSDEAVKASGWFRP